jgi:hypothetical protein
MHTPALPLLAALALVAAGCRRPLQPVSEPGLPHRATGVFFDDFAYASPEDPAFKAFGWRTDGAATHLGPKGATFQASHVTFVKEPGTGATLVQLTATTAGTGESTLQSGISTQGRRFFEGTYAARVRFFDQPFQGPAVDRINETFYTISSFGGAADSDYSECDFEYLARGGWDVAPVLPSLFLTTWHSYVPEPWTADNASHHREASLEGWHVLTLQVMDGEVRYFVDDELVRTDGERFYPRKRMDLAFNLWFLPEDFGATDSRPRTWIEQVDWVLHACDRTLSPRAVRAKVARLRAAGTIRQAGGR